MDQTNKTHWVQFDWLYIRIPLQYSILYVTFTGADLSLIRILLLVEERWNPRLSDESILDSNRKGFAGEQEITNKKVLWKRKKSLTKSLEAGNLTKMMQWRK